jgi:Protein of unknown function (DUF3014)
MTREGTSPVAIAVVIVLMLGASAGIVYWWLGRTDEGTTKVTPQAAGDESEADRPSQPVVATEPPPRPPLPPLDDSDRVLREWGQPLSTHPEWVRWLASTDLARRFVAAIDNVARGQSPRAQLGPMRPEGSFQVREEGGHLFVDGASYRRYDLAAEVFASVDLGAAVRLYHDLEPLFESAYAEIGEPSRTFQQALARAIDRLLAVQIPEGELEVERHLLVYQYADPELEALPAAAKHLLRMGPENARRVQSKLRFLRSALDLPS